MNHEDLREADLNPLSGFPEEVIENLRIALRIGVINEDDYAVLEDKLDSITDILYLLSSIANQNELLIHEL